MTYLDKYRYDFPEKLVAHEPASPRDSARMFVYECFKDEITHTQVSDLASFLPPESLLVVNDTKVVPARINTKNSIGLDVELLLLLDQGIASDNTLRALVRGGLKVGEVLQYHDLSFTVLTNHEKSQLLKLNDTKDRLLTLVNSGGTTPLPPYIETMKDEDWRREHYQTVFAQSSPSVAAPTASLHFTDFLIQNLLNHGHDFASVTLQVGLGTFEPITEETFDHNQLHSENYHISKDTSMKIKQASDTKRKILAIGTTVVRTLESAKAELVTPKEVYGRTNIFIKPPYHFTYPDILLTNFHVPRSSLMCLVEAFLQSKGVKRSLVDLYKIAIAKEYRFFSFGDAMLII